MYTQIIVYKCDSCGILRKTYAGIQQHVNCCKKIDKNFVKQKLKLTKNDELKGIDTKVGG